VPWQNPEKLAPVDGPDGASGRHRRPESLADGIRLRPTPGRPASVPPHRPARSAGAPSALSRPGPSPFEVGFSERAAPAMTRAGQPRAEATTRAGQRRTEVIRAAEQRRRNPAPRPGQAGRSARRTAANRPSGGHSRHGAPRNPAVPVRPIPAVRDAVVNGLPAAKRAAGAVRRWALHTGDKPPAVGTHRAPGTLPLESWLLVGRTRQQALLASLVLIGLLLVAIPVQHRRDAVNPVSAAEQAVAAAEGHGAKAPHRTGGQQSPAAPRDSAAPATSAPAAVPAASGPTRPRATGSPPIAVPYGTGPGSSLRTTGTQAVALTFDDGPDPVQTPKILAMLARYGVKATFCLVGRNVQRHPDVVREIVAAGHTLCNHTWDHSLVIGKDTPERIQADLQRTNAAIQAAAPGVQIAFFRAPGGNFTDRLVQTAYVDGMTSLYWAVDPRDWEHPAGEDDATHVEKIVSGIRKTVQPGSIVLSHDFNQPDTIKAYEQLLPWLTRNFELGLPPEDAPAAPQPSAPASPTATVPPAEPTSEPTSEPPPAAPAASAPPAGR
jgi:peptidoglycan-N-acetylglucosamine deacetylase